MFDDDAFSALRFVQHPKALGLSLAHIVRVRQLSRGGTVPCACVRTMLVRNLRSVDQKLRELRVLRSQLRAVLERDIRACPPGSVCRLTEP